MAASKDVAPMTAFLYVPFSLIICEHNIRKRNPSLAKLYDDHPELFKKHREAEYNLLIIFIMHEISQGEKSFWYPYLEIINRPDLPFMWSDSELDEFQDAVLIRTIKSYREEFESDWKEIYSVFHLKKYDHILPGVSDAGNFESLRELYIRAFDSVVTRCFGWGLPCTMMVPFADCINHHNVDSSYEMIRKSWPPLSLDQRQAKYCDLWR